MSNQRSRFNTEDWWAVCLGLLAFVLSRLICRAGHHRMGCERENLDRAINVHWRRFFSPLCSQKHTLPHLLRDVIKPPIFCSAFLYERVVFFGTGIGPATGSKTCRIRNLHHCQSTAYLRMNQVLTNCVRTI
jgi:hypothetical protein